MTSAEFQAALVAQGFGTSLTPAQFAEVEAEAMRLFSRQRPLYALATFDTVIDQETYNLPAGGHICIAVSPQEALDDIWAEITGAVAGFPVVDEGDYFVDFHRPSLVDSYRQKLVSWSRQFGSNFEQDQEGGPVRLLPRPDSVATMAWLYTKPHAAIGTVPEGDEDLLLKAGKAAAYEFKFNLIVLAEADGDGVTSKRIGPVEYTIGNAHLKTAELLYKAKEDAMRSFLDAAYLAPSALKG